jgi:NADP-dependent 3-hydroxy acid dehydrogenase YdfG
MGALSDQVAVVTGAGSGIGQAIARAIAGEAAVTCLVGRTKSKLDNTAMSLASETARFLVMPADLSSDDQMDTLVANLQKRFGQVDLFVSAAGEIFHGPLETSPLEALDRLYRANVRANYRLTQLLLPMLKKCPGQIVFINSTAGLSARPNVSQFSATQHALKAVTDALRDEVNANGIRVLSVYPGRVATPRQQLLYENYGKEYAPELLLQPEDIASVVLNALTLPRTAEVTDIFIRPLLKSY